MTDFTALAEQYIALWNETGPARRKLIDALCEEDVAYTDPLAAVRGRDALDGLIGAVQEQFPGMVFRLGGPVDGHHDLARFTWHLGPRDGEEIVVGFDVVVVTDGRIGAVHGFLDKVPAAA
ncbi:nuclear transport factor 2 family protein [Planobispora siamensis]|uniref:Isomerase n=1 Tax=Planobispora siamensis TaxID=936338 RepID=A0A8J3SJP5_9ACTN|nr:nuclear transport factor 2 family protein [Planobispora siamensis]GIH94182.1 isomerase [Planobispora siamensis]